jgi:hypothetical protein
MQQIGDILEALVLDKEVEEIKSTGRVILLMCHLVRFVIGRFRGAVGPTFVLWLPSFVLCAECPWLRDCIFDGVISSGNCGYYETLLDEDLFQMNNFSNFLRLSQDSKQI